MSESQDAILLGTIILTIVITVAYFGHEFSVWLFN